jgi:hypothetical protein
VSLGVAREDVHVLNDLGVPTRIAINRCEQREARLDSGIYSAARSPVELLHLRVDGDVLT